MKIIERFEHTTVKLHKDIDYTEKDFEKDPWVSIFPYRINQEKLNQLAKSIGYEECIHCNKLHSVNDTHVNVVFKRKIE